MITIVDYGLGNLGSIANMLRKIGAESELTSNPDRIATAEKLILPGVGAFDNGMEKLTSLQLVEPLTRRVKEDGIPVLGICLGAQLLTRGSEEGDILGLGWIEADTIRFCSRQPVVGLKIPHMGWNDLELKKDSPLFAQSSEQRFYFVHSYHFSCDKTEDHLATTVHGYEFTAAFNHKNVFGVQFHPEKSHRFGMEMFRRFAGL